MIPTLKEDNISAVDEHQKAHMLNTFFSKCWNNTGLDSLKLRIINILYSSKMNPLLWSILYAQSRKSIIMLNNLNTDKATGSDNISGHMLKATARSLAPSLTQLFNLSISLGTFPTMWKMTRVVPIPKSSDRHSPSGYRPISLLPIVGKLLEKHIHCVISDHLNEYSPLSSHRWGFRCGKSTTAALLAATQDWLNSQDNKKDVCFVFFDLQKAFDKVPHHLLLAKLKQLQLHPIIMTWLHSYLYRREQFVVVNGKESVYVISGVPQGSVLGPLLFSMILLISIYQRERGYVYMQMIYFV